MMGAVKGNRSTFQKVAAYLDANDFTPSLQLYISAVCAMTIRVTSKNSGHRVIKSLG